MKYYIDHSIATVFKLDESGEKVLGAPISFDFTFYDEEFHEVYPTDYLSVEDIQALKQKLSA